MTEVGQEGGEGPPPAATRQGRSREASSASPDRHQVPKSPSTHRGQRGDHSSTRRSLAGLSRVMLKRGGGGGERGDARFETSWASGLRVTTKQITGFLSGKLPVLTLHREAHDGLLPLLYFPQNQ